MGQSRFNALVADEASSIEKARLNILRLEPRVPPEDRFLGVSCGEHTQYVLHCQTMTSDDRFAAEDLEIRRDARQKFGFAVHRGDNLEDMVSQPVQDAFGVRHVVRHSLGSQRKRRRLGENERDTAKV